ncbi:MAG: hypothetical protein ACLFQL_07500 [Paracoccaceae bacterium]
MSDSASCTTGRPVFVDGPVDLAGAMIRHAGQVSLRNVGAATPAYLDGVFDKRGLNLAKSTRPPFVGTRWRLAALPDGAWLLACQNDQDFSLAHRDGALYLGRQQKGGPIAPMQWLFFIAGQHLLIRSRDGLWLGARRGRVLAEPRDDLDDPDFHWNAENFW